MVKNSLIGKGKREISFLNGFVIIVIKLEGEFKSFNYKITDYKKGIRDSRSLFTSAVLKGGPTTAEEIVDAYINANRSLYEVNRDLYQDIEAAKILGMSDGALYDNMENRGERRAYN